MRSTTLFVILSAAIAAAAIAADSAGAAQPSGTELRIEVSGLRNAKGMVHACLTQDRAHFPDCDADPRAFRVSTAASEAAELRLLNVPAGHYALSLIHDENGNGKLDTFAMVPREGFGFSRNPPLRFGPPRFDEAQFDLSADSERQVVRLRYLL
jgi:uncharacterized protein (DUF2141 family)